MAAEQPAPAPQPPDIPPDLRPYVDASLGDPHYRDYPLTARRKRRLMRVSRWRLPSLVVGYLSYVGLTLVGLYASGQTITAQTVLGVLGLVRFLQLVHQSPVVGGAILALALLICIPLLIAAERAHQALRREPGVLELRAELAHFQQWQATHAVARGAHQVATDAQAVAAEARATAQRAEEAARAAASGREAAPEPQGPPFDEGLLPAPDRLVGREGDLAWLLDRLRAGQTAAITALRGLGGIGKSALAAVAIRRLRAEGRFPDGIAVVLAAGLSDPATVLAQALTRFDPLRRPPEASDLAGLAETAQRLLAGKQTLIVLDNVEPGWPVERVVAPLTAAGATVLLTARQALGGAVPAGGSRELELLRPEEALELFAQSYGKGTTAGLSAAERAAAERITSTLEYHTLAVKLAGSYAAETHRDLGALAGELERDPLGVPDGETPRGVALALGRSIAALDGDARRLFGALATFATAEFGRQAALALGAAL
ncbi:MAG TPA: NB-ARC domain-containing protein, partial [Ktedonobacterales bacterium]|nr:NB-ARC domain-containing protein [Ktedonobacterales bacterium]